MNKKLLIGIIVVIVGLVIATAILWGVVLAMTVIGVALIGVCIYCVWMNWKKKTKVFYFLPKTALGKWSIGLLVGTIVFVLLAVLFDEVFRQFAVANTLMLVAVISGASAFFTGIIGIIRNKERSVIIYIATLIGFLFSLVVGLFGEYGW